MICQSTSGTDWPKAPPHFLCCSFSTGTMGRLTQDPETRHHKMTFRRWILNIDIHLHYLSESGSEVNN